MIVAVLPPFIQVGIVMSNPSSPRKPRIQKISFVAKFMTMTSASVLDCVVVVCLQQYQHMMRSSRKIVIPKVDLKPLVSRPSMDD
jgi:hypothetical protein